MTNQSKNALFTGKSVGNVINVVFAVAGAVTIGYMVYVQLSGHHFNF